MRIYGGPGQQQSVNLGVNETSTILMILIVMVFIMKTKRFQALVEVIKS